MASETEKKRLPILPGMFHGIPSLGEKANLIGSKCRACGRVFFPKHSGCPVCMTDDTIDEVPLSTKGTIDTFTVIYVAPLGFKAPYIQGFVNLPEGPRIFSLITGCNPLDNDLKDGTEVELVIDKITEDEKGNDLIGYKFQPVRT